MRRREFIRLIGTAALGVARPAVAHAGAELPLVGVLMPFEQNTVATRERIAAIRKGLQEGGFTEGETYSLATRFANEDLDRMPLLAKELGALNPRVIVVLGYPPGPVHALFPEIPLVFTGISVDPIRSGYAHSYARPGGMLTGNVMNAVGGNESITEKRIGLFKQIVPDLLRLGMIAPDSGVGIASSEKEALRKVAAQFGFEFLYYGLGTLDDLEGAFASGRRDNVSAFYVSGEPFLYNNMSRVMPFVAASGKPTVGTYPTWGRGGLLMSYSADPLEGCRNAGGYAAKILGGARPGDLPIMQASKFTLVINQKTAKALGIVVPPTLLALADEVIE